MRLLLFKSDLCNLLKIFFRWSLIIIRKNVAKSNERYHGTDYQGSCVIFTQGNYDLWSGAGINKQSQITSANTLIITKCKWKVEVYVMVKSQ